MYNLMSHCSSSVKLVLLLVIFITSNLFSQGLSTTLTITVTRADNGKKIAGAEIYLFGAYEGTYYTNEAGIVKLNKKLNKNDVKGLAVMTCSALGFKPAPRSVRSGNPGGLMVTYREFSRNRSHHTIGITLQHKGMHSQKLSPPEVITPIETNVPKRNDGYLIFKWRPVPGAYKYQLRWADNADFRNAGQQYADHVSGGGVQSTAIKIPYKYFYWKIRASDGTNENSSDFSNKIYCTMEDIKKTISNKTKQIKDSESVKTNKLSSTELNESLIEFIKIGMLAVL